MIKIAYFFPDRGRGSNIFSNYLDNIHCFLDNNQEEFQYEDYHENADIIHFYRQDPSIPSLEKIICKEMYGKKKIIIDSFGISSHIAWAWHNEDSIIRANGEIKKFNKAEFEEKETELITYCDLFRTPSLIAKNSFMTGDSALDSKILIRPPGYNSRIFNINVSKNPDFESICKNKFVIGFFGRLRFRRGFHSFIDIISGLSNIASDCIFLSCGEDNGCLEYARCKSTPNSLYTYFPKTQNDIASVMRCCNVSITPSIESGFNLSAIEAIACGCYPIVSANTGISNILIENSLGNIINPYSIDLWIKNIYSLYNTWKNNKKLLETLSLKSSRKVVEYDNNSFIRTLKFDYRKVMEQ